jgi:hypothetical protein
MITKIYKLFRAGLVCCCATAALTACSPEKFDGPNQAGIPSISGVDFNMNIDQSVNQATFTANLPAQTYAVWTVNGDVYSTLNPMNWANNKAGTYDVELRLGNRNGFSQGSISKQFTFENSQVDFTAYYTRISRTWRINYAEQGHMGCGEPGTDGSNWWSAAPGDKADWGVYDDRLTFDPIGGYIYDPGEGGTVYVNTGCSIFSEYNTNDGNDFMAPVEYQTSSYKFDVNGDKIVLQLPKETLFPYLSSDAQFANPVFTVVKLTNSEMILLYEGEGITWRFMFTSKEDDAPKAFKGYKFDSDGNMLRDATWEISRYYAHGDGWEGYNAEDISYTNEGNQKFVVNLPHESNQRWQAQFQLQNLGGVATQAGKNYDFSIKLKANQDLNSATVKLTDAADDTNFYFDEVIPLEGDTEYLLVKSNMEGRDIALLHLVFDFGGCAAGTVVEITDMVLKDHAFDDGAGQPEEEGGEGGGEQTLLPFDFNDAGNMLKDATWEISRYYAHGDGWEGYNAEDITYTNEGNQKFVVNLPHESNQRWQAQFQLQNLGGVATQAGKTYDFSIKLKANQDLNSATVKLTAADDDTNFYFDEVIPLEGDTEYTLVKSGMEGKDISLFHLVFDFGGCQAGTVVEITDMVFKEHSDNGGSGEGGGITMNYDDADNLWKAVDEGSAFDVLGYYFAAGDDWHAIDFTEATHSGNAYEITLPADLGKNQWQGQFHIDTKLTASASKKYNFQFTIETDDDCPQVTMKLTDAGDTNYFIEERNDVPAGTNVFNWTNVTLKEGTDAAAIRLFFDFGGSPGGTNVKISKIVFKEN